MNQQIIRAGRPTRAQAEARHIELLESALDHFLDQGYERATIEAIAASVNMTKRTIYARYPEKEALFMAAVQRAIEQAAAQPQNRPARAEGDLETRLTAIALARLDMVKTPQGLKLQRIIDTESYRFPVILTMFYEKISLPTVQVLAEIMEQETRAGTLHIEDPLLAANIFLSMVVGGPVRAYMTGNTMPPDALDRYVRTAVHLFLNGARVR